MAVKAVHRMRAAMRIRVVVAARIVHGNRARGWVMYATGCCVCRVIKAMARVELRATIGFS